MSHQAEQDLTLLVRQMRWESDGVMWVMLEDVGGAPLPEWQPGAHLDLHLPAALVRQYSLCGDPGDRRGYRIAVLREPQGRGGSAAVHDKLHPGMVIAARGPRNNFALRPASRYAFVAGGIGITPILGMLRQAQQAGTPWTLVYGGRSRATMAFVDEVRTAAEHSAGLGRVTISPQDEVGLLPLAELFAEPTPDTLIYCCGPEPLLAAVDAATTHWPTNSLVVERFTPLPVARDSSADTTFDVVAASSGISVEVGPGQSIVQALEAVGVYPSTSCEEGICGTCETTILDGVAEHRDSLLSDEERAAGRTLMICVSRCVGRRLVLDL